ncbi:MAG: NAD(P)/FAD-dependent oxidoreductase [Campylobacteraceae bacterium]|nr:NAD(P)/FAD-dependent oxidoreductase [Campylobacteraceae bacterium]
MSRRDALKLFGSAALLGSVAVPTEAEAKKYKKINKKIVILGGGLGGISLAAKLNRDLPNSDIVIVDGDETFYYQPGFTLIGIGFYQKEDVIFDKNTIMPKGVEWVKQHVNAIKPEQNSVVLANGESLSYDYLVVATGLQYEFEAVKGLTLDDINNPNTNISSIYTLDGAVKTNKLMEEFANKGGKAIFADQKSAMKCSGANKKMVCMSEDRLRRAKNRKKGDVHLYIGGGTLFGDPTYAAVMSQIMVERDIKYTFRHQIVEVDQSRNVATFEHWMPYKENGEDKIATELVEVEYDWFHLPPKQVGFQFLADAGLTKEGDKFNWLAVNKQTLQSTKYENIFGIGDILGIPMGKTGASVRKMYPTVFQNIVNHAEGKPLVDGYDGYTACPFLTRYGKAIMVEFNWEGTASSMEAFGKTRESYINWLAKVYGFKPMIMKGMMKGLV